MKDLLEGIDALICGPYVDGVRPPWPLPVIDPPCCEGAATRGPDHCSCWEPVYDVEQQPLMEGPREIRPSMCEGCAYRPGTEAAQWRADTGIPDRAKEFFCHIGTRKLIAWRHPSGLEIAHGPDHGPYAYPDDPEPVAEAEHDGPTVDGRPYDADGSPSPICTGWAVRR